MRIFFFLLFAIFIISTSAKSQQDTVYTTKAEFTSEIQGLINTIESLKTQIRNTSSRNRVLNESVEDLSRKSDSLGMALYCRSSAKVGQSFLKVRCE